MMIMHSRLWPNRQKPLWQFNLGRVFPGELVCIIGEGLPGLPLFAGAADQ